MIRPILRLNVKKALLFSFAALGPLGNLLTPPFFPASFRAYYFLLPCFPFFFLQVRERIAKMGALFLPFLIYCYLSAVMVENFGSPHEDHTLFRFYLLLCQFLFIIGAASVLRTKEEIFQLIKTYVMFYFLSMLVGYIFFFGYYLQLIPISLISRFSVIAQFGFGLLRFSPGSYPNEYGIVSSFVLSILLLILFDKKETLFHFSRQWLQVLIIPTFLAFLLTTTRAAYLSFLISLIYISWKSKNFIKTFIQVSIFIGLFFIILIAFNLNMFTILAKGFSQKIDEGSLGERYFLWRETIEQAKEHPLFGIGFASLTNIHNVYLQLLFELGIVGSLLLLGSLLMFFLESFFKYKRPLQDETSLFLKKIRAIGLINVLSFAASNHNLNHHLTWLVFFLCLYRARPEIWISSWEK